MNTSIKIFILAACYFAQHIIFASSGNTTPESTSTIAITDVTIEKLASGAYQATIKTPHGGSVSQIQNKKFTDKAISRFIKDIQQQKLSINSESNEKNESIKALFNINKKIDAENLALIQQEFNAVNLTIEHLKSQKKPA